MGVLPFLWVSHSAQIVIAVNQQAEHWFFLLENVFSIFTSLQVISASTSSHETRVAGTQSGSC